MSVKVLIRQVNSGVVMEESIQIQPDSQLQGLKIQIQNSCTNHPLPEQQTLYCDSEIISNDEKLKVCLQNSQDFFKIFLVISGEKYAFKDKKENENEYSALKNKEQNLTKEVSKGLEKAFDIYLSIFENYTLNVEGQTSLIKSEVNNDITNSIQNNGKVSEYEKSVVVQYIDEICQFTYGNENEANTEFQKDIDECPVVASIDTNGNPAPEILSHLYQNFSIEEKDLLRKRIQATLSACYYQLQTLMILQKKAELGFSKQDIQRIEQIQDEDENETEDEFDNDDIIEQNDNDPGLDLLDIFYQTVVIAYMVNSVNPVRLFLLSGYFLTLYIWKILAKRYRNTNQYENRIESGSGYQISFKQKVWNFVSEFFLSIVP